MQPLGFECSTEKCIGSYLVQVPYELWINNVISSVYCPICKESMIPKALPDGDMAEYHQTLVKGLWLKNLHKPEVPEVSDRFC